jgi:2-oxoglutarate ferredoxin oxidoreductase subunit beta
MNNHIYGMTGGQFSPLAPYGTTATTAPFGNTNQAFDIVELVKGAGASFVARTTTYHVLEMQKILKQAIMHKGFSTVEVLSQCPTYFGRKNRMGDAVDMLNYFKAQTTAKGSKKKKENPDLIERGIFIQESRPEYCEAYRKTVEKAQRGS